MYARGMSPPLLHFDHIGLVVADLSEGRRHLTGTLQISRWTESVDDHGIGVSVQFGLGDSGPCVELIAPLGEESPVANALRKGHRILSHLAYITAEIQAAGEALEREGCVSTGPAHPAVAYGGALVQFWISPLRFIIELIEAPGHQHAYQQREREAKP